MVLGPGGRGFESPRSPLNSASRPPAIRALLRPLLTPAGWPAPARARVSGDFRFRRRAASSAGAICRWPDEPRRLAAVSRSGGRHAREGGGPRTAWATRRWLASRRPRRTVEYQYTRAPPQRGPETRKLGASGQQRLASETAPQVVAARSHTVASIGQRHRLAGVDRWQMLREKRTLPVPSQLMSGRLRVATLRLIRSCAGAVLSPFITTIPPYTAEGCLCR